MICGEETNEKVVLKNYYGEWQSVRSATPNPATYDGTTLRGGPYDGMKLSDLPDGAVVYVDTTSANESYGNDVNTSSDSSDSNSDSCDSDSDSVIDKAVRWAVSIANDNTHGYSQSVRWGPSYDCSSLVISAWEQAGVPVKTKGATYTGNMLNVFLSCGFRDVTSSVNRSTGSGLEKGDVLLNVANHTVMSIGDGKLVAARSSNGTSDTADNAGNEITIQSYYNYPSGWDYVLRYKG